MSAITATLRRHPTMGAGAMGAMAGASAGGALGFVIAFNFVPPLIVQHAERGSPLGQAPAYEQLHQHVVRENSFIAPRGGTLDKQQLLYQHVLRENGAP